MRVVLSTFAVALMLAAEALAQAQTASEMYWDAVRRSTGPIGFPQATPDDPSKPFHPRRPLGPGVFAPVPYFPAPEPVYVPVYVPGPIVYVPVPAPVTSAVPAPQPAYAAPPAPRTPETFYVIPGCYGGNRPPTAESLPAGCDITKLRVGTW